MEPEIGTSDDSREDRRPLAARAWIGGSGIRAARSDRRGSGRSWRDDFVIANQRDSVAWAEAHRPEADNTTGATSIKRCSSRCKTATAPSMFWKPPIRFPC